MPTWHQIQSQLRNPNNPVVFIDVSVGTTVSKFLLVFLPSPNNLRIVEGCSVFMENTHFAQLKIYKIRNQCLIALLFYDVSITSVPHSAHNMQSASSTNTTRNIMNNDNCD